MADLKDVAKHFSITPQALAEYIRNHDEQINHDGRHAARDGGRWVIDAVAVQRIEALKGWGTGAVMEKVESEKIKQAAALIREQQNKITELATRESMAQMKAAEAWQRVADVEKEMRTLTASTTADREELGMLRERTATQGKEVEKLKAESERLRREAADLRESRDRMTHASLWQRIMGRW